MKRRNTQLRNTHFRNTRLGTTVVATGIALGLLAAGAGTATAQTPPEPALTGITKGVYHARADVVKVHVTYDCPDIGRRTQAQVAGYLAQVDKSSGWMNGFIVPTDNPQYLTCRKNQKSGTARVLLERSPDPVAYYPPRAAAKLGTNRVLLTTGYSGVSDDDLRLVVRR